MKIVLLFGGLVPVLIFAGSNFSNDLIHPKNPAEGQGLVIDKLVKTLYSSNDFNIQI